MLQLYLRPDADAWALLADALAREGVSPLPPVARGPWGKPCFPSLPGLHFNLSHTAGFSLCALSDSPVGVDIELLRPRREGLWRHCLTDPEYTAFLADGGDWAAFYRLWTLKEAWCKREGAALGHPRRWATPPPGYCRHYTGPDFVACVCAWQPPGGLTVL